MMLSKGNSLYAALLLLASGTACGGGVTPGAGLDTTDAGVKPMNNGHPGAGDAAMDMDGAAGDAAGAEGDGGNDDGGIGAHPPHVTVVSPQAVSDPNNGKILVGSTVDVTCKATPGASGSPIDPTSVSVEFWDSSNKKLTSATTSSGTNPDEYVAKGVATKNFPSGKISIHCLASDSEQPANSAVASIDTFYDSGPIIVFTTPKDGTAYSKNAPPTVVFTVSPNPLVKSDQGAAVDASTIALSVGGFPVTASPDGSGGYQYPLDFTDQTVFPGQPPPQFALAATAANKRSPTPATGSSSIELVVDSTPPSVVVTSPATGSYVSGEVTVLATITDAGSGLKTDSIWLSIANGGTPDKYPFSATAAKNTYAATFQVGKYLDVNDLTLNIQATDNAGNTSATVSVHVYPDSVPPWVSLTPPNIRELFPTTKPPSCSIPFDPVGDGATNDGAQVTVNNLRFRAVVWERGIETPGAAAVYRSGVDETNGPTLYVSSPAQGQGDVDLIVDTDGDTNCDNINLTYLQETGLTHIATAGQDIKETGNVSTAPDASSVCTALTPTTLPALLCTGASEMTRIIEDYDARVPVIYGVQPKPGTITCTGDTWNTQVQPGWSCFVATARDKVGNLGISAPVRIWYSPDGSPPSNSEPAPTCHPGCTMPALFTDVGMPVMLTPK